MPNDFYPVIPTNRQNAKLTSFNNDNMPQRQKLGIDVQRKSPSLAALYEDEPSVEELLAQAQGTLDKTGLMQGELNRAAGSYTPMERFNDTRTTHANLGNSDEPSQSVGMSLVRPGRTSLPIHQETSEANAPRPETTYMDVAESTLGAGSFIPGPVGVASRLGSSAIGAYDLATEGPSFGNVLQASAGLFDALPAIRGLRAATVGGPVRKTGAEIGAKVSYPRGAAQSMQLRGELPVGTTPPVPSAPMPYTPRPSMYALQEAPEVNLTSLLDEAATPPLSPAEIGRARMAERFGKTYRSEGAANPSGNGPRPLPSDVVDDAGRMIAPAQAPVDPAYAAHRASSVGKFGDSEAAKMKPLIKQMFGDNLPPSMKLRMSALEALEAGDEVAKRTQLFGGASSSSEGTFGQFVRPKDRKPIGTAPERRGAREDAIQWNQR